jgi:hypothetical protein
LPSRNQPTFVDERYFKYGIVHIAVRVGFDQLHSWDTVEVDTVVQVRDSHKIFVEVGMSTTLPVSHVKKREKKPNAHAGTYLF